MAERKGCRFLIEKSAADKVIVPDALELAEGFLALCCQPSEAESCQSEGFGHGACRDAFFVKVGNRWAGSAFDGNAGIDFIAEDVGAGAPCNLDDFLHHVFWDEGTGRVVRIVDADEAEAPCSGFPEFVKIGKESIASSELQHRDIGSKSAGRRAKLLVARGKSDDPVSGTYEGEKDVLVSAGRAMLGKDIVRGDRLIEPGDFFLERGKAVNASVGLLLLKESFHEIFPVFSRKGKEFLQRHGTGAGVGDIVFCIRFVLVHPFFHAKPLDIHASQPFLSRTKTPAAAGNLYYITMK